MKRTLTACLALLFPLTASAANGELWEITTKTEMPGVPFAMPANTMQVCMDKGDVSDPRKSTQPDKDCKITDIKKSGNKTTWKMRCDRNGEVMTGTGEITVTSGGYQGVSHVQGKSSGQDIDMTSRFSGKNLGKSCDTSKVNPQVEQAQKQAEQQRKAASSNTSKTKKQPSEKEQSNESSDSLGDSAKKLKGLFGF